MSVDAVTRVEWIPDLVQKWRNDRSLENTPLSEVLGILSDMQNSRKPFDGVVIGTSEDSQAFLFVFRSAIAGLRLMPQDLRGRDGFSHMNGVAGEMNWRFYEAPQEFSHLPLILASVVTNGGKQLVRSVDCSLSKEMRTLEELDANPNLYLMIDPEVSAFGEESNAAEENWLVFGSGSKRAHRLAVGMQDISQPTPDSADNADLVSAFRSGITRCELFEVLPRYLWGDAVEENEEEPEAPHVHVPHGSGKMVAAILVALAVIVLGVGAVWLMGEEEKPAVATSTTPTQSSPDYQGEISSLRQKMTQIMETSIPEPPLATGSSRVRTTRRTRTAAPVDAARERRKMARIDSLMHRIDDLKRANTTAVVTETPGAKTSAPAPAATAPAPASALVSRPDATPDVEPEPIVPAMPVVKEPEAPTESADVGPNYSPVLVDVPPKTLKTVTPIYPAIAKSRRVKGMVLVNALVGSNGKVIQALTLRGELTLRQAAVNCVEKWEFTPAIRDGKPVKCWKAVTVSFQR